MNGRTVAITGVDSRENPYPGLAIARSLRADPSFSGRIIALTYGVFCTGIYRDDLFDAVYLSPPTFDSESKLLHRILEIHSEDPIDVLIPALDTEIAIYSRLASTFADNGIRTLLPSEKSVKLRNKDILYHTCRSLGIRTPKTLTITQIEQLDESISIRYPLVIKGPFADAHVVEKPSEIKTYYLQILKEWGFPVLLQEKIVGEEFDIAAVAGRNHEILGHVPIRKFAISERGKASAAIVVQDPELGRLAGEILGKLKWIGPCELELMRETATGQYHLLEINARFPAWIYLTAEAGCNLPALALRSALGDCDPEPLEAIAGGHLFFRNRIGRIVDPRVMWDLIKRGGWRKPSPEFQDIDSGTIAPPRGES